MRVMLFTFVVSSACAAIVDGAETRNARSTSEESFEEKLEEGYNLLKSEPSAEDTMKFLKQLHNMKEEIKDDLTPSLQRSADSLNMMETVFKNKMDHIQPIQSSDSIEEINQNSKVDTALFQGDMILTKEQTEEIMQDVKTNKSKRNKRQAYRDKNYPKTLWSQGLIYAFWNASYDARMVFKKAAGIWTRSTCINFGESRTATDRINVIKGGGCWSYVGRLGGEQSLSLGPGCESVGTAVHEIGHALGLFHTQSRHDRDDFVTLYPENFREGWLSQFIKQSESTNYNYNLTYDYGSVMHYAATSVSKNGKPIVVPLDVKYIETLGSRFLSFYDKLMVNMHYGCLEKCNGKSSAACENGGFPHPRDCSKCICPSGYGGRLCNERPSGCGKILTATTTFQTLEDTLGKRGSSKTELDYTMCHYWIEAPVGSTIEVVFDNFTQGLGYGGCPHAGVEVKTGKDKRHTGYKFCDSKKVGISLISTYNVVPVITFNNIYETKVVLRYRIASSGPVTSKTTHRPTAGPTTSPAHTPRPDCEDVSKSVCNTLMTWDFCRSSKYDENLKKLVCPQSCNLC